MEFKYFIIKFLVHLKTFDTTYIRVFDYFLGREKHLSGFFPNGLFLLTNFSNTVYFKAYDFQFHGL